MTSSIAGGFASLPDPYWSVEDYVRFADHPSAEVRLWGLEHLDELGLEIPVETLRRRLQDVDLSVATKAAALVGQLEVTSLADVLHARLERAEDAVGAACAGSLALLGDPRVVKLIRQRSHLPVESRDPRIWVALSDLKGPEAQGLLLAAFDGLSSQASATTASLLASTLMLADPERGIPRVVGRWAGQGDNAQTDALLHGLLLLCAFLEGTEEFRNAMDPDQEPSEVSLPKDILDGLADLLPLGPIRDIRKSCHRRKWSRALAALVPVAEPLASRAPIEGDVALARLLVPALAEHAETIYRTKEKSRDAVGLLLLAFDQLAQAARETNLVLPEGLDAQLGWLLSDAAFPYPQGVAAVSSRLIAAGPAEAWERMCIQTIERRAAQAATAASLLGAWESKRAIPVLLGALAADDDIELPTAAAKALVNIGEPAMGAIVQTLASSEDHAVLGECLDACIRLPSRRAVDAICLRFGELFAHAPEALLEAVRWIGAREFVEPLRAEVREGERQAEDTFAFLCDLHGAADDRLPGIRERQMSEISRRAGGEQDLPDFSEDHIDLALQCNGCHRTYTYPVKAVYIDPDPHEEDRIQPFIKDRIRCKGCGRENDYTLAPAAYLALTGRLLLLLARIQKEGPEAGGEGPLFLMKMGLTDGRRMNPREARLDYEARLTKLPDDPQLLIGYANLLRFLGETDRAETELRRALVLEPRAAEAYATLGQLAEARGDLEAAKELYRQCLDQGWRARFFQVEDRRALIQNVEEALGGIEGAMAMRPAEPVPATARLDALIAQDQARLKVGRNDPCPCGSGKKYKKCCLLKQSAEPVASGPSGPEIRLQERLDDYLERSLPKSEVRRAMQVYFGEPLDRDGRRLEPDPEALDAEWPAFRDWLLYDFRLSDGQTPIARFLSERGHRLPADERAILVEWQDTAIGLQEVVDLDPGKSLTLRDVFTEETHEVREVRGSLSAARWDLISHRLLRVQGAQQLAGAGILFRPSDRDGLVQHVRGRYEEFRRERPDASWRDFFQAESLIFRRYAVQLASDYRPPALHTPEGHPVVMGRLRYAIRDERRLLAALSTASDFEETAEADDPAGARYFAWIRTGPAQRYVTEAPCPEYGMTLTSQRIDGSGKPGPTGLASLTLTRNELTVETLSAQRLAWIKARLNELAGDAINLRADIVEDVWKKVEASAKRGHKEMPPSEIPPEVQSRLLGQTLHRHFKTWLDEGIPALEGRTPRAAAGDLHLRPRLIQLLREIENHQDRARQQGQAWYDIAWMWEDLGISRKEA